MPDFVVFQLPTQAPQQVPQQQQPAQQQHPRLRSTGSRKFGAVLNVNTLHRR